jgi:hypothetical protein
MHGRRLTAQQSSVQQPEWPQRQPHPSLLLIAHAVYERARDARARVHDPHLILAGVVPRRDHLGTETVNSAYHVTKWTKSDVQS